MKKYYLKYVRLAIGLSFAGSFIGLLSSTVFVSCSQIFDPGAYKFNPIYTGLTACAFVVAFVAWKKFSLSVPWTRYVAALALAAQPIERCVHMFYYGPSSTPVPYLISIFHLSAILVLFLALRNQKKTQMSETL